MTRHRHKGLALKEGGSLTLLGVLVSMCAALIVMINVAAFGGWRAALGTGVVMAAAVGVAVAGRRMQRIAESTTSIASGLTEVRVRLDRLEALVPLRDPARSGSRTRTIDLATLGPGDASALTAATLDRTQYPRLVAMMEMEPPAEASMPRIDREVHDRASDPGADRESTDAMGKADTGGPAQKDLLRAWRIGWRNGDFDACRSVYAALVDTVEPATLSRLSARMEQLAEQTERTLRDAFAVYRRRQDAAGMLAIGKRICKLLPDRAVADEFRRIEPDLQRLVTPSETVAKPTLRVIQ